MSEESARMIAEVFPKAADLATKRDVEATRTLLLEVEGRLRQEIVEAERRSNERFSSMERRFFGVFAVPLWGAVAAGIVKLFMV
jgi:hypothetical protein